MLMHYSPNTFFTQAFPQIVDFQLSTCVCMWEGVVGGGGHMLVKSLHPSILNYICQTRYVVNLRIVLQDKCCHPCHEEKAPSRVKKVSKAFTRKRRVSKFMAERIYRNTGVVVAIGSGKYILYLCFLISVHDTQGWHCSSKKILLLSPFFFKEKNSNW